LFCALAIIVLWAHAEFVTARAPLLSLGPYRIIKHLAAGGMADVWLAKAPESDRHVVVKCIGRAQANDDRYVAMFLDEARLAASLDHPNVVKVHDSGTHGGEYFFTMEYVHCEDARRLLTQLSKRGEKVPLEHVISIITSAAAGLHHAHRALGPDGQPLGIVHRDVSPANILIGYDGTVKVADFGIAKAHQRSVETQAGTLKGKVAYMSPEQCVADAVDCTSDVFSLGIVLYELLTVRRLFKGDNDFLTMTSIVLGHIPPPSKYRPDLPELLEDIILKALENKPADRYQSADELRLALVHFAEDNNLDISAAGLAAYMKRVFGEKPAPWCDDEPEVELSIDFDGSASGVVAPVADAMLTGKIASDAPLRRAQTVTEILDGAAAAPAASVSRHWEDAGWEDEPEPPPRVIVDPDASQPVAVQPFVEQPMVLATEPVRLSASPIKRRSRTAWFAGSAVALGVAIAAALFVMTSSDQPTRAPKPVAAKDPRPEPPPAPPPVEAPVVAETQPAVVEETAPVTTPPPVKRPRAGPAKKKPRVKPPAKNLPPAGVRWRSDVLFPTK
jgi:hypothetical protein